MRYLSFFLILIFCYAMPCRLSAQKKPYQAPGNGNPLIPGYFADPTVKKFNDTYYIYATTDGNGGGLGPSQVWTSKDFVNWTMHDMNWPTTHFYWAPDVALGNDGKYYLYYCQPTVEIYGASSSTPLGPWTPLYADGKAVVPNYLVPKVITLDGQTFKDDDGKFYMTWGTWGIYPGYGCGIGLLNADMRSFAKTAQIPNTVATDFFEGSFMFKRKGVYYLLYSSGYCENETYRVQYATSKKSPMEGFSFGKNNPILATSADSSVHGPGHNSVLQVGDDYYIIYHRHNNPHSGGGYNRQICADKLLFDEEGNITKIIPTHTGIGYLANSTEPYPNLVYQKKVTASSYYNDDYRPEFAVDDNNGTLWKPKNNSTAPAWLQVDLGKVVKVKRVLTQFEYATWYYQYKIEYSVDAKHWQLFADRRNNQWHGSPAVDANDINARYIRLTITGTEYPGLYKAVWNLKVYGDGQTPPVPANLHQPVPAKKYTQKGLLININADDFQPGAVVQEWKNGGVLGGTFKTEGKAPFANFIGGKKAVVFTGQQSLTSNFNVPLSLAGNNSYTVAFWAYKTQLKDENPLLGWTNSSDQLSGATFGYGANRDFGAAQHYSFADIPYTNSTQLAGKWHYIAITFDGTFEKVYVDGELNNEENKMLFMQPAQNFWLGSNANGQAHFSGAIASLQVYDRPLAVAAIKHAYHQIKPSRIAVYLDAAALPYGKLRNWVNEGDAGGSLKPVINEPTVQNACGRISLNFTGKEALVLSKPLHLKRNYSLVVSEFLSTTQKNNTVLSLGAGVGNIGGLNTSNGMGAGHWHLMIKTVNGHTVKEYVDGKFISSGILPSKASGTDSLAIGSTIGPKPGFSGAIAGVSIYRYTLSDGEIRALSNLWQRNLHPPLAAVLIFKQSPRAISPEMIEMEAGYQPKNTNNPLQYQFSRLVNNMPVKQSGWTDDPHFIDYGLAAGEQYAYTYKVRDNLGNVSNNAATETARTSLAQFYIYADDFSKEKNYLAGDGTGLVWDGFIGKGDKESAKKLLATGNNTLKLESEDTNWDGAAPYGPFIYKTIKGDFIAEVEVSDVSGLAEKKVAGNNEVGLMVRAANSPGSAEQLIQNGIFPAWHVGNMLTNLIDGNRQQTNTQAAWNYNKYLQIQRDGNLFYVRTSADRLTWLDLPGSPVLRKDLDNKTVQVGLYQCTYGPGSAYGCFANFRLVQPK